MSDVPERRGHRWKPGQSGNPKGRPRVGESLAAMVRHKVPPEKLVVKALEWLEGSIPSQARYAHEFLATRGYGKPQVEVIVSPRSLEPEIDLAELSQDELDQLEQLLDNATARALPSSGER